MIGCGGAGFPTHIKASAQTDTVLANGAECEPLLHKDIELMQHDPEAVAEGLSQLMFLTGAKRGIVGVKKKHEDRLERFRSTLGRSMIEMQWLEDFYPTGDEYVLVYETTGRLIPPQGIPLDVNVVVNNVETLRNIYYASQGIPVTTKYVTIAGAVKNPLTMLAPIGASFSDIIKAAGGATVKDYAIFISGLMMGQLTRDTELPITKTCAGIVVLPLDHRLVQRKMLPEEAMHRIGKSACDQCSYCTEFCPRYMLGYDVQPHKVMRSLGFTATGEAIWNQWAQLCCACGLCTLYACPEDLYPKEACDKAKRDLRKEGIRWAGDRTVKVHPIYEGRHVPLKQLISRLGVSEYDKKAPFKEIKIAPNKVRIPLLQHIGEPAVSVVSIGKSVKVGELLAETPSGKLGTRIHASIEGVITSINREIIIEQK